MAFEEGVAAASDQSQRVSPVAGQVLLDDHLFDQLVGDDVDQLLLVLELLGTLVRAPDAAQGIAFVVIFPLTFIANSFVTLNALPAGLRAVAEWNPLSATITAVRQLFRNPDDLPHHVSWALANPVVSALLRSLLLLAMVIPAAVWRYRKVAAG